MKISTITIKNFRSIKEATFKTSDFNIFVGQNNCGKTNFFEAVEFFYNGLSRSSNVIEMKYRKKNDLIFSVEIEFTGVKHGLEKMRNETNQTKIQKAIGDTDVISVIRDSSEPKKRSVLVAGDEVKTGTGFDNALNDFLPKFEYIHTKQYHDSVAKYSKTTPIGIMLSGVLEAILQTSPQYKAFQDKFDELFGDEKSEVRAKFEMIGDSVKVHLEKQFPDTTSVKFEVSPPAFDDLLKNFSTSVDDGIETSAEEKGDGMQRALMLAIIQAYSDFRKKNDDKGKSFLFFIDEAELHLHPTAQRKLKEVLYNLSQDTDQVFINTHSSVFVADKHSHQSIFKVEKNSGDTEITLASDNDKPDIVFELLGGSPADLLLPRNFLIVEGQSEYELLSRVIKRFYSDKPMIQIVKAQGDIHQAERTINSIEKVFIPLEKSIYSDKVVILIDQPSEQAAGGVRDFKSRYRDFVANNQLFELPERDIEQCYPERTSDSHGLWRKTQAQIDEKTDSEKPRFDGTKKRQLAKHVGDNITMDEFERDLSVCHQALEKCWELAFN
ncbi:MAG: ATP-binding protein [Balneolales bacterium]|nr:ATP-binding protein [Balneolales bacterium]